MKSDERASLAALLVAAFAFGVSIGRFWFAPYLILPCSVYVWVNIRISVYRRYKRGKK